MKILQVVACYPPHIGSMENCVNNMHRPIRLLSVGRLTKQKNFPLLIRLFKLVVEKNNFDVELHIVGDREDKNEILNLIKKEKLENKIILHGSLLGKDLYDIYSNSDIFILTSRYESLGLVLIEAMASGLPIIVSNITAVKNIVKNNIIGLLVKPSPKNFAQTIEKLTGDSQLREKLIKNGLEKVRKYDWNKILQKLEYIYSGVVDKNIDAKKIKK